MNNYLSPRRQLVKYLRGKNYGIRSIPTFSSTRVGDGRDLLSGMNSD